MSNITVKNLTIGEGIPKIVVPLMGATDAGILEELQHVKSLEPDIIEWRVDAYMEVEKLESVMAALATIRVALDDIPLLFTFRSHKEGGNRVITDSYYVELLTTAIRSNEVDLLDIELFYQDVIVKSLIKEAKASGVCVIVSNHNFTHTPSRETIISRLREMQSLGADIPKIAVMPTNTEDVLTLLDATNSMVTHYADRPIITMAMGSEGLISRLAGEVFGSALTFGAGKEVSAPGQIDTKDLRIVLEILHKNK
ncbi:type I 3-dehydroquinate dehydratase [Virgibacillus sp. C22-A2]|uniref:3-dehydroquinate dehydratase n=1 Tax=Virgibacillus tibetensis TaxID=3042313 RepID=A0ABU6KJ82_9BACI|nr:type I 3-dehydroquinate dehydratase [Virgibacillus sp. C22-A2]